MRRNNIFKVWLSAFLVLALNSAFAVTEFTLGDAGIETTAVDGDILIDNQGNRYVYKNPYNNKQIRIPAGNLGIILVSETNNGYVYVSNATLRSLYSGDYLASQGDNFFAASSARITAVTAAREARTINSHISNRTAAVLHDQNVGGFQVALAGTGKSFYDSKKGKEGMAAGDMYANTKFGVWLQPSWSHIKDTNTATEFKADMFSGTLGADATFHNNLMVGLAYTYSAINNGKTEYNRGEFTQDSHTVSPYVAYKFNDMFSLDGSIGYADVNKDTKRTEGFSVDNVANYDTGAPKITGKVSGKRWFVGAFGSGYYKPKKDFTLSLRAGYFYVKSKQKEHTESNGAINAGFHTSTGTASAVGRADYQVNKWMSPFVQLGYQYDASLTKFDVTRGEAPDNGKSGYVIGGGVNLYGRKNWSGFIDVNHNFGQGKLKMTTVSVRVRYDI